MSSSSWYHSNVGGGSPVATHSSLNPLEFENVALKQMLKIHSKNNWILSNLDLLSNFKYFVNILG